MLMAIAGLFWTHGVLGVLCAKIFLCRRHAPKNDLAEVGKYVLNQERDPDQQLNLRVVPVSSSP